MLPTKLPELPKGFKPAPDWLIVMIDPAVSKTKSGILVPDPKIKKLQGPNENSGPSDAVLLSLGELERGYVLGVGGHTQVHHKDLVQVGDRIAFHPASTQTNITLGGVAMFFMRYMNVMAVLPELSEEAAKDWDRNYEEFAKTTVVEATKGNPSYKG